MASRFTFGLSPEELEALGAPLPGLLGTAGLSPEQGATSYFQQNPLPSFDFEPTIDLDRPEPRPFVIDIPTEEPKPVATEEPVPEFKEIGGKPKVVFAEPEPPKVVDEEMTMVDNLLLNAANRRRAELAKEAEAEKPIVTTTGEAAYAQEFQQALNGPLWKSSAKEIKEFADRLADEVFGGEVKGRPSLKDIQGVVEYRRKNPDASPSSVAPLATKGKKPSEVVGQIASGAAATREILWGGVEALQEATGVGDPRYAETRRQYYNAISGQLPQGTKLEDVRGFGDALKWAQGAALTNLSNLSVSLAGGVVGGVIRGSLGAQAGAFGPSFLMETGSIESQNKELNPDQKAGVATLLSGSAAAMLDSILPGKVGSQLVGRLGREAAEEVALRTLLMPANKRVLSVLGSAGRGAGMEGSTEAVQQAIEEIGTAVETGQPVEPGLLWRMVEAGAAGAVIGAPANVVGDVAEQQQLRAAPIQELATTEFARPAAQVATERMAPRGVRPTPTPVNREGDAENFAIPNGPITSRFGPRHPFRTANGQMASSNHAGIDIGLPSGSPVPAGASGVVVFAGKRGGYGNQVVIKFSDGTTASYSHLSKIGVKVGEEVAQGEVVGKVGATGNATGPHLHLERRDNQGRPVNPLTGRMVRTTVDEDGRYDDDTPWDTEDSRFAEEEENPFPQEEIDQEFAEATGQTLVSPREEGPEAVAPEPSPPSPVEVQPLPRTVEAVIEVLADSPAVEEIAASTRARLDEAQASNRAEQELARIEVEQPSQPGPNEEPLFAEDQQTVVGFVNPETGAVRPLEAGTENFVAAPLQSGTATTPETEIGSAPIQAVPTTEQPGTEAFAEPEPTQGDLARRQAILETLPAIPAEASPEVAEGRELGRQVALGLQEVQPMFQRSGAFRTAYNVGFTEAHNAAVDLEQAPQPEALPQEEAAFPTQAPIPPEIDARLERYDDKLFDLETDGTKADVRRFAQKLVKEGVIDQAELNGLAPIFKDRDMGVEDITSELRTSLLIWAERQGGTNVAEGTEQARSVAFRQVGEAGPEEAGRELNRPRIEEDGTIVLDHWSPAEGITETDPAQWGRYQHIFTPSERAYMAKAPPRTYFGISTGEPGGYKQEFQGRHLYHARIPAERLYDVIADPDGLWVRGHPEDGEWAIKNAGYAGYWYKNRELGLVAVMFENAPVSMVSRAETPPEAPQKPAESVREQKGSTTTEQALSAAQDAYVAYRASVHTQVIKVLKEMNLQGMVPIEVVDSLSNEDAAGHYDYRNNVIRIAGMVSHDVRQTTRHEIIHWAVENRVWNAEEWRLLTKWAKNNAGIMRWAQNAYEGLSENEILEEAVAEGFARWDQGQFQRLNTPPDTAVARLLQKLKDIIDAIRLAFTQSGVSRGELRAAVKLLAEFENGTRMAKFKGAKKNNTIPSFGRKVWQDDLSREMLSGNIRPEEHWFLSQQPGEKFQTGWHGSPKDDIAQFSLDFIGTGEGAQAFGWGLYFAEKKDVADWYRRKLTMPSKDPVDIIIEVNGKSMRDWAAETLGAGNPYINVAQYEVADRIFSFLTTNKPYNGWLDALHARFDNEVDVWVAEARKAGNLEEVEELLASQRAVANVFHNLARQEIKQKTYPTGGKLYKVEVPESSDLLDMDKPLRDQPPKVKEAIGKIFNDLVSQNADFYGEDIADAEDNFWELGGLTFARVVLPNMVYHGLGPSNPSQEFENAGEAGHASMATSIWLRDAGIAGSRYLDRDSRVGADEQQTRNFVIFDDNLIELKAKYRVIRSSIASSPLSDPTIPNPGIFRRIHDQTMGMLGALAGKDVDASDNIIDAFRRKVTQRYQQVIKTQKRAAGILGVDRLATGMNPMEMITADERGYKLQFLTDNMIRPMATEMSRRGVSMEDLGLYLYARHAPARNARIALINKEFKDPDNPGSGMKDVEAQQIMIDFASEGKISDLQEVAKHIDAMIQYAQQERVDGGLISLDDVAKGFQPSDFYVPLRGNEEIEPELEMDFALATRKGGGFSISGKESHRMFGRASRADLEEIVGYTITQAQEAVDRSYRNKVSQSMLAMFRTVPDKDFVQIDRVKRVAVWNRKKGQVEYQMQTRIVDPKEQQRTIYVKEAGSVTKMTFNDKNPSSMRFVKAAKNLGIVELPRFLQIMSLYTRIFTKANTQWNIDFVLANAAKDIQTGVVNASTLNQKGLRRAMIKNLASMRPLLAAWWGATHPAGAGLGTGKKWKELYAEFSANGGKLNYGQVEPLEDAIKSARREIKTAGLRGIHPIKMVQDVGGWIDRANSAFENMTRLAAYGALRDAGIDAKRAAVAVRELTTNFQQHGEWGPKFNAAYGFANASVIGGARFATTMAKKPYILAGLIGIGMLEDWLNSLWDKDEWDSYTEEDKNANYFILLPQAVGFDIKVPAGYGLNAFITVGRKFSELWRGKKKADGTKLSVLDAASDTMWSFYNAFAPVSGHSVFNVLSPSAFDPIVDIYQNQNNWGRPIMPPAPERKEQQKPDSQLAFENTGQFWKTLATTMNVIGGGNEVVPGWTPTDISPESYKHVTEETVGGAGRSFFRVLGLIQKGAAGEDIGPNDIPIVRRFASNPYGAKSAKDEQLSAFYDRLNQSRVVIAQAKELQARFGGDSQTYQEFRKDNEPIINFYESINKAEKVLRAYNTAENAAERGAVRADGLKRRDRKAIFKATRIAVPSGRPLTDEEVAKIKKLIKEKKEALAMRFNELWLSDVMKETE